MTGKVQLTPPENIQVRENRQRREFDEAAHQELLGSITQPPGLQNAPIVRIEDSTVLVLVSGERRLRAMKDACELGMTIYYLGAPVAPGFVPFLLIGELGELEAEEAELDENIRRVDLTWQEKAAALARLETLRTKQWLRDSPPGAPAPTQKALAQEVHGASHGGALGMVRRDLILAKHLDRPEIQSAKSADEAMRILRRAEETTSRAEKGLALGPSTVASSMTLVNQSCLDFLKTCPEGFFDVVLTDPPYGMGADEFSFSAHGYDDSEETWRATIYPFLELATAVTKPAAHLYLFCDFERFAELRGKVASLGWKPFRTPLVWYKPWNFRAPWPEHGPQRKYECILYAVKGNRPCLRLAGDVLEIGQETGKSLLHSAQKPVALFREFLSRSASPGDRVLDGFCGTGPIFEAAASLKVFATGCEIDPGFYSIAADRVAMLKENAT